VIEDTQAPPDGLGSRRAVVAIHVPAHPEYVALLRAACGQLAPLLGCSVPETADLRLAVDEATGFLLRNCITPSRRAGGEGLAATFVVDGEGLRVTLAMEADVFVPPNGDEFGWAILTALVDDLAWCVEGSNVQVRIGKRRPVAR